MVSSGFIALIALAAVHIFANRAKVLGWVWHGKFLSFAAGISFAYVFVDLLPALEKGGPILRHAFEYVIPYLDRHTYLIALFGVLFYYGIQSSKTIGKNKWAVGSGYLLFNFLVGAALSNSADPEIQPIALFTVAMGMHYFVRDHMAKVSENRPLLIALVLALFAGYLVGYLTKIPDATAVAAIAFVAGGVLLNVLHYEFPKREKGGYLWFLFGALLYTFLLLLLGEVKY